MKYSYLLITLNFLFLFIKFANSEVIDFSNTNKTSLDEENDGEYEDEEEERQNDNLILTNPYKNDKDIKHSLYRARNTWNRISGQRTNIPPKFE